MSTINLTLAWDAPVDEAGEPLAGVTGYQLFGALGALDLNDPQYEWAADGTEQTIDLAGPGTWQFAVRGHDAINRPTPWSEVLTLELPELTAPRNLRVVVAVMIGG